MSYLLEQAAPTQDSQQVMLEGPDAGPLMPGLPSYPFTSNLIPLSKCLAPETLVAFRLNGQFLPPRNGFPGACPPAGMVWHGFNKVVGDESLFWGLKIGLKLTTQAEGTCLTADWLRKQEQSEFPRP